VVPSAFLRVYQPLDAFDRAEQTHWERYLIERSAAGEPLHRYADRPTTGKLGVLAPAGGEHADVLVLGGQPYVSPWRMRMRILAAMLAFRETRPMELWDQVVPKKDAKRVARELARFRRRDPRSVAFSHQSPWHVPIRWFVLVGDDERWIGENAAGRTRLRYRTTTRKAMRRAEMAIPVLRRSDLGPISELLVDLHQWMAVFDPRSVLELDYADLCDFLTWDELDDDHSARDIAEALDALGAHEFAKPAEIYQGVLSRWAEIRSREILN
jgi:hypothetical protein